MAQDHNRTMYFQVLCLIGLLICGYLTLHRPIHTSPRIEQSQPAPSSVSPRTANSGLVMTLEGPAQMSIHPTGSDWLAVRFRMTIRNNSASMVTFSTYDRMLAFYDSTGKLVTDLDDYWPDIDQARPGFHDIFTLEPGESVQLFANVGAFRQVPPRGLYSVAGILRRTPENWFIPDVAKLMREENIHLWSSDCHSENRLAVRLF